MTPKTEIKVHSCKCSICQASTDPQIQWQHQQINLLLSQLNEPQRRWYVGFLSQQPNSPSQRQLSLITGLDAKTIRRGRREMTNGLSDVPPSRQRRNGSGRRLTEKKIHS